MYGAVANCEKNRSGVYVIIGLHSMHQPKNTPASGRITKCTARLTHSLNRLFNLNPSIRFRCEIVFGILAADLCVLLGLVAGSH